MIQFLIAADDRTGALETAGACADAGAGAVTVVVAGEVLDPAGATVVVDLATRHITPAEAAGRAAAVEGTRSVRSGHKIDSTLRGNWAHELVSRHDAGARRVLVVAASPGHGRTCVGGVVMEHGQPVASGSAGRDARTPVRSSRPADHLRRAGATDVVELHGGDAVRRWLRSEDGGGLASGLAGAFGVCDATVAADLAEIADAWVSHTGVLLAGTAAAIGAAAAALPGVALHPTPALEAPVLVVCGSLHAAARRQVEALAAAGVLTIGPDEVLDGARAALRCGACVTLTTAMPATASVGAEAAQRTVRSLAAAVAELGGAIEIGTLIVLGGDTAAEVLGAGAMVVGGTVAPGTPWGRRADGGGPLVITTAGASAVRTRWWSSSSGRLVR